MAANINQSKETIETVNPSEIAEDLPSRKTVTSKRSKIGAKSVSKQSKVPTEIVIHDSNENVILNEDSADESIPIENQAMSNKTKHSSQTKSAVRRGEMKIQMETPNNINRSRQGALSEIKNAPSAPMKTTPTRQSNGQKPVNLVQAR